MLPSRLSAPYHWGAFLPGALPASLLSAGSAAEPGAANTAFVVRLRMSAEDLPKERLLHPLHNLMESWQLAGHLCSKLPLSFWLACADVDFDDLVPPAVKPGEVHWGPTFWGFVLPAA